MAEKYIVGSILVLILLFFGIVFIKWPHQVRKYDGRMTMIINNPRTYEIFARLMGGLFLLMSMAGIFIMLRSS